VDSNRARKRGLKVAAMRKLAFTGTQTVGIAGAYDYWKQWQLVLVLVGQFVIVLKRALRMLHNQPLQTDLRFASLHCGC